MSIAAFLRAFVIALWVGCGGGAAMAADYTQGVEVSGTTARIWLKSNVASTWADVHYQLNGGIQQNFRMSAANARFEQSVAASSGSTLSYFFTYNKGELAYDTPVFTTIVGSAAQTPLLPDFGPNVTVFEAGTPASTIQAAVDSAFNAGLRSPTAQFGSQRHTFLFKPGSYGWVWANLGYYTTVAGLGRNPDDVTITGALNVDSGWNLGDELHATQNFWRSAENLALIPEGGTNRWAVSQAAPMRRVHIRGNLTLGPSNQNTGQGWSSGGYLADVRIDGRISSGSQQQWFTRNSTIGGWDGGVWNMVFAGVQGAPAQAVVSNPPYTVLATAPTAREKPYLFFENGTYQVFVPSLRLNSSGVTWPNTPGTAIPLSQFYIARPGVSADTLNQALAQGLHLFFTPGIYNIDKTLQVARANTVVFGLGFPTLVPQNGVNPMKVADVDGVNVSGLLFDAGPVNTPILLEVGNAGQHTSHAGNPISIQDVYFRVGGPQAGKSATSLVVHADDTLLDHIWAWRGDHGAGIGWSSNTADTGLVAVISRSSTAPSDSLAPG